MRNASSLRVLKNSRLQPCGRNGQIGFATLTGPVFIRFEGLIVIFCRLCVFLIQSTREKFTLFLR